MKKLLLIFAAAAVAVSTSFAVEGTNSPYTDAAGDIDPGIANGGGTLDILGMEVTNNATDITFTLTLNGNISSTNWGTFVIGIGNTNSLGTTTGNAWGRPINLVRPDAGGMTHWIGSWVNFGGGSQLWSYNGSWSGPEALAGYSFGAGTNSTITYTATLASLGLAINDTFYFDAYSTGGGGSDSAVDSLANPNVSITSWSQTYTSSTVGSGGLGLNSYQVVPEPSTYALLALSGAGLVGYIARRRARK